MLGMRTPTVAPLTRQRQHLQYDGLAPEPSHSRPRAGDAQIYLNEPRRARAYSPQTSVEPSFLETLSWEALMPTTERLGVVAWAWQAGERRWVTQQGGRRLAATRQASDATRVCFA